jgi:two-component system sensor histidine kinase DegS
VPTLRKHVDILRRIRHAEIDLEVYGERRLKPALEIELFMIAQEALNNALKHAQAKKIDISIQMSNGRVSLTIRDDGEGFDPADPQIRSKRLGLTSMQELAAAVDGNAGAWN